MLDSIIIDGSITTASFFLCTAASLILGLGVAWLSTYKSKSSKSFALTLALLPAVVQLIIGNIGAGVAVAGAFGLVRFRSAPGTAKEIAMLFLAMALGLATGMGYLALAAVFFVVMALFTLLLTATRFAESPEGERELKITIPENLDYDGLFDDLLEQYTKSWSFERVRTSNMGTLYELDYRVTLKSERVPKTFLDELRCRNGNLNIVCARIAAKEAL